MRVLLLLLLPGLALAQSDRPSAWRVKTDAEGGASSVSHAPMPPGWHITTGSPSILYDPGLQARGRFAVEAEIHLFPGQGNDGYGIFLGGSDLDTPGEAWVAFLLTRDGSASIVRRRAGATTAVHAPSLAAAVKPHPGGDGTVLNQMRVLVQGDSVVFSANGQRVVALARGDLTLDGVFGFRVGRDVNLHVSNLDLVTRLAPFPARR